MLLFYKIQCLWHSFDVLIFDFENQGRLMLFTSSLCQRCLNSSLLLKQSYHQASGDLNVVYKLYGLLLWHLFLGLKSLCLKAMCDYAPKQVGEQLTEFLFLSEPSINSNLYFTESCMVSRLGLQHMTYIILLGYFLCYLDLDSNSQHTEEKKYISIF